MQLTLKAAKCQFAQGIIQYLGHTIGNGERRPLETKVKCIQDWPAPEQKKDIQQFLRVISYYQKYLPHASTLTVPLTDLCQKNLPQQVQWTETCEKVFEALKTGLASELVLKTLDFHQPFTVQTYASESGLGAVLLQHIDYWV